MEKIRNTKESIIANTKLTNRNLVSLKLSCGIIEFPWWKIHIVAMISINIYQLVALNLTMIYCIMIKCSDLSDDAMKNDLNLSCSCNDIDNDITNSCVDFNNGIKKYKMIHLF
jgi:hypothetical protein